MISAEIIFDPQHGPIVTVRYDETQISVYLIAETGTVVKADGTGYGIEVKGDWLRMRNTLHGSNGSTAQEEQSKRAETYKSAYRAGWNDSLDAYNGNGFCQHCAKELREERDYISVLSSALDALKNVPRGECSEEVQETLNAVIEDVSDVLVWFRCG